MKKNLFYLALAGWQISLTFNLLSIFDIYFGDNFPIDFYLVIGLFLVCIPAIFFSIEKEKSLQNNENADKKNFFFRIDTPRWVQLITVLSLIYTTANFLICINGYTAKIDDGKYVLMEHSKLIKYLTETEYIHHKANDVRLLTGHLLTFYAISLALLYGKE